MTLHNFTRFYADYTATLRATITKGSVQYDPKRKKLKGYQKNRK